MRRVHPNNLLVALSLLAGGCELPATPPLPNACGGAAVLVVEDAGGLPGEACGPCADGVVACDGADALVCVGASALNGCGGCGRLPGCEASRCPELGAFNDACSGEWVCDEAAGSRRCVRLDTNACGGAEPLLPADARPGWVCQIDEGQGPREGTWSCIGANAIRCVEPGRNRCGGDGFLAGSPGEACLATACVPWRWACQDGLDDNTVVCAPPVDGGTNFCGGCQPLGVEVGSACGCAGEWVCDPDDPARDRVRCEDPGRNACGGCEPLAGVPGAACPGGVLGCDGQEAVRCAEADRNRCGGRAPLERAPGEPCGPCGDGLTICVTPDAIACVGASAVNACGGCGFLQGEPGGACGPGQRWRCEGTILRCEGDPDLNPCGGPAGAFGEGVVWRTCGEGCATGRMGCASPSEVRCVVGVPALEYYPDVDGDGFGEISVGAVCVARPGLVTNRLDCDDQDDAIHPAAAEVVGNAVDEDCDGVRSCFLDRDGDGHGDPFTAAPATRDDCSGAGQSALGDDCDDRDPESHPGHAELCGDLRDNDCDLVGDEPECIDP